VDAVEKASLTEVIITIDRGFAANVRSDSA